MSNTIINPNELQNLEEKGVNITLDPVNHLPIVQPNNNFKAACQRIHAMVQKFDRVASVSSDTLTVDELRNLIAEVDEAQKEQKRIDSNIGDLRKFLTNYTGNIINALTDALNTSGYDRLNEIDMKTKQLKQDLRSRVINDRWEELRPVFELNLDMYPRIKQYLPTLADFENFRFRNPKLVSGAKNDKINDKKKAVVNTELARIDELIGRIIDLSAQGLEQQYIHIVVNAVSKNPTDEQYYKSVEEARIKRQQDIQAVEEANRRKQEQERLLAEKAQIEAENARLAAQQASLNRQGGFTSIEQQHQLDQQARELQAKRQATEDAILAQQRAEQERLEKERTLVDHCKHWLGDYVVTNHKYSNVASDKTVAAALIQDVTDQFQRPSTEFAQFAKGDALTFFTTIKAITDLY